MARRNTSSSEVESPDMTVEEVALFRRESPSAVQRKMRDGTYVSYLSGDRRRLITRESVLADRARRLAEGPQFGRGRLKNSKESLRDEDSKESESASVISRV
jgi:hypothetical protein